MKKYICLYNPYSGNNHGFEYAKEVENIVDAEMIYKAMPGIEDFDEYFKEHTDNIIICGGDGTLNYFVNRAPNIYDDRKVYYYSTGTGNDFYNDIANNRKDLILVNKYLKYLPTAYINDKEYKFLNNTAFGLDGYACLEGDRVKKKTHKPINYTLIALKGILGAYKPTNAKVIIDGKEYYFNKVWMIPTMNGRYMGGGMMIAPNQDRLNKKGLVTLLVLHDVSRFKILTVLPKVFNGTHLDGNDDVITVIEGHEIHVIYDEAKPAQIDGEVIPNVKEYKVKSRRK